MRLRWLAAWRVCSCWPRLPNPPRNPPIIIGRDGKVAADHIGYGEGMIPLLVDELNKLLAQKA